MTMTPSAGGVERRIGQRFPFNLPVSLRDVSTSVEGLGFTQDVSSRGVFLFTVMPLSEGAEIELTLKMPSEITLGESMRVRCRGRVLRIVNAADNGWKAAPSMVAENRLETAQLKAEPVQNKVAESGNGELMTEVASAEAVRSEPIKIGVAVCLKDYEYLSEAEDTSSDFRRISALHTASETERVNPPAGIPRIAIH
jgi:hypothetical protein